MRTLSAILLMVCFSLLSISSLAQELKNAETLYSKADKFYEQNKYQDGIDVLENALLIFIQLKDIPGQVKSQNLKAECLANLGKCDKAVELIQNSLALCNANLKADHPELANTYYFLSRAYGGCARKFDEALPAMQKSMSLKRKLYGAESLEISYDYNFLGYLFDNNKGQRDSAFVYLNRSMAIRQKKLPADHIEVANTLYNLARVYEGESELSKALELHQQSYKIRRSKFPDDNPTISNSLSAIGNVYQKFGNNDRALEYYLRALEIRKKTLGEGHTNVAASYYNIGNLYNSMFDYHSALQYYQQGNRIMEKNLGASSDVLITYLAATGKAYGMLGEKEKAVEYIQSSKELAEKNLAKDHPYLAIVYSFAGDYYSEINDLRAHSEFYTKAIAIFHKASGPGSVREADVLVKMGNVSVKNDQHTEALIFYEQALAIFNSKMGKENPKSATVRKAMGDVYTDQQRYIEALRAYQQAYRTISTGLKDSTDLYSNPQPDELENKSLALKIATSKARTLFEYAVSEKDDLALLKQSLSTWQFAVRLIDQVNADYNNENAKQELERESRKTYIMAMRVARQLYTLTKDQIFLEQAFTISEKSKSIMLSENIRDHRAKTLAGVPDSLIDEENNVKIVLAYFKTGLYQARKGNAPSKVQAFEKNIFETQQKYDRLKAKLEKEFPAYYDLKYNTGTNDITTLQNLLSDKNTAVMEFFVGDSSIYIFSITKSSARLEKRKNDKKFKKLLEDYEKSLTDFGFILNSRKEADALYTRSAYLLYDFLLKPFLDHENTIRKLIILPDDVLAQLNFGTLITKDPGRENPDYKTVEYLTKKYQISYAYSAAFIKNEPLRLSHSTHSFAGFAPSYSGNQFVNMDTVLHPLAYLVVRNGNLPLPGAEEEVKDISAFMHGKSWLNAEASESNFKKYAGEYAILHLAMHSLLNSENPEYSELLFSPEKDQTNDGFLKVSEIYNLNLNADLVVLSACSSGYGKIQTGEGPISISRAFSYAGCPSVVMSLWKVPDDVTRQIMTYFYEGLLDKKEKDEALRLAQLKFLNETQDPLYHHPYFWAGFVVMGDTRPIPSTSMFIWVVIGALVIVGGILFGVYKKRRIVVPEESVETI
jgi:CHAT domain-containing protein